MVADIFGLASSGAMSSWVVECLFALAQRDAVDAVI